MNGYGLSFILWQAQYAWLMNINARAGSACAQRRSATGPRNAWTAQTKVAALAKGTSCPVGMAHV